MTDSLITLAAKALAEMYEPHERWEDWATIPSSYVGCGEQADADSHLAGGVQWISTNGPGGAF